MVVKSEFNKCYKFRIYPTEEQKTILNSTLRIHRNFYNFLVGYTFITYKLFSSKHKRGWTQWLLNFWKSFNPESKDYYSSSIQYENWKLHRQIKSLYSNKKTGRKIGKLKFKGRDFFNSFTYNSQGFKFKYESGKFGNLELSKIGNLKIRVHRSVSGIVKNIIIKKEGTKWFSILTTCKKGIIGLDMGLGNFVYDSDKKFWERPKIFETYENRISFFNKKLSRTKKGSNNREKIKLLLSNVYSRRTRAREDYLHKVSNYYAERYSVVVVEDLNIAKMVLKSQKKGKGMRRNIFDASWGKFFDMLEYKLKDKGGKLIKVNPKNTSKTCSKCGNINKDLELSDRIYYCKKCGLEIDRDYNASINIKNSYLSQELTFAENQPLQTSKEVMQVDSEKQEATTPNS